MFIMNQDQDRILVAEDVELMESGKIFVNGNCFAKYSDPSEARQYFLELASIMNRNDKTVYKFKKDKVF